MLPGLYFAGIIAGAVNNVSYTISFEDAVITWSEPIILAENVTVIGYKICYWQTINNKWIHCITTPNTSFHIRYLMPKTQYVTEILCITDKGSGIVKTINYQTSDIPGK